MAGLMPNYDYDVDAANLQRRLQLAEALTQGSLAPMGPTEQIGGYAVHRSPIEALAKIAQAYMGGQQQQNVLDQQRGLATRYRSDLQSGIGQLLGGLNAQPGDMVPDSSDNFVAAHPSSMEEAQSAKRSAILGAIGSNVPAVQQTGMGFISQMMKDQMTTKDWLALGDKYSPESILAALKGNNPQLLQPKKTLIPVNNQLVQEQGGNLVGDGKPVGDYREKFGDVGPVAQAPGQPPVMGQRDLGTGQVHFAPPGTQISIDNSPQKAADRFATELAGGRATAITKSFENAQNLPQQLQSVKEAKELLQAGMVTGQGADIQMAMTKLAQKLGVPGADDPKVANSEEFKSKLANQVLEKIKILRPASDKDVEYAKQASGADLSLSAQGLSRLLDSVEARIYNEYFQHEHLVDAAAEGKGALPGDLAMFHVPMDIHADATRLTYNKGRWGTVPPPESATAPKPPTSGGTQPGQRMSLEEYLNHHTKAR